MKKQILLAGLFAVSALISACSDDEVTVQAVPDNQPVVSNPEKTPETQGKHIVLHGVANGDEQIQKTKLDEDMNVLFTDGDKVALFDGTGKYELTATTLYSEGKSADFEGTGNISTGDPVLYPYQENASFSNGVISAVLPANQTATLNSFDPAANLSVAKINAEGKFALRNIGSLLKLTTTEAFSKIVVKSVNEEKIAGECTITIGSDGIPTAAATDDAKSEITLSSSGTGDIAAGSYYVALLPVELKKGFVIEFYQKDASGDEIMTSDTYLRFQPKLEDDNGITFERCGGKNCGELLTANGVYIDMVKVAAAGDVERSFSIGRFEVTQRLWMAVMGDNPSHHQETGNLDLPVEQVSFLDLFSDGGFLSKLNAITHKNFSLPTMYDWILAAKGGDPDNTNTYSGSDNYEVVAWFEENSEGETHKVGTLKPNKLGIYDMSGNVSEYTNTDWTPYTFGGDFRSKATNYPIWEFFPFHAIDTNPTWGFRLAL